MGWRPIKYILILMILVIRNPASGQSQIALYQMQKSVPQANYVNPAFVPASRFVIGLPVISSSYISFEAPFAVSDVLIKGTGDSLQIDRVSLLNSLKTNNRIDFDGNSSLLFLGMNGIKGFMSLSFNTRLDAAFAFPGSIFDLLMKTPEAGSDGSKNIALDDFELRASVFNEVAFSYNREINDKLIIGGKLKYLQGIANVNLQDFNGRITSSIDSIHIETNNWSLQTSGIDYLGDNPDKSYFLFKNKNTGWAIDLGAQYLVNDNIRLSASILDLGSITWKDHTKIYEFESKSYTFEGFDFLEIVKDDGMVDQSILDQELDSIKAIFDPVIVEGESYKTPLTGRFYLGGTYSLMNMHTFGTIIYGEVFKSRFTPSIGLTYNLAIAKILDLGISASYRNKSLGNFGIGVSVMAGPIQVYLLGENFESIFYPARANVVGLRGGLVLSLGKSPSSQFD